MSRTLLVAGLALAGVVLASVSACSAGSVPTSSGPPPGAPSPPAPARVVASLDGASRLVGVNLDWTSDTVEAYAERSGRTPDVLVNFFRIPLGAEDERHLRDLLAEAARYDAVALVTLEPVDGLAAVTYDALARFTAIAGPAAESGVPVLVRFAHEMNGSWYPWSQQPVAYREAFTRVAGAVHQLPGAAMLWAPNYGGGYPFVGGRYEVQPGFADHVALDTSADGRVDGLDDPYAPYYPGDDVVDWVGMSLYHWGARYPWGENETPEPDKFAAQLTGTYLGAGGDDRALPDFYSEYAVQRRKPLAIPETAALFQPGQTGAVETSIKSSWFDLVFAPELAARFPELRMINWFEWRKSESEIGGAIIDWRATGTPTLAAEFTGVVARWLSAR